MQSSPPFADNLVQLLMKKNLNLFTIIASYYTNAFVFFFGLFITMNSFLGKGGVIAYAILTLSEPYLSSELINLIHRILSDSLQ